MEGDVLLLPLTRKEFRDAKMGKILEKRFQADGCEFCAVISNKFISLKESDNLLHLGFNVLPLDISGVSWRELDRRFIYNVMAEYSNGMFIALVSQNMYHQMEKETEVKHWMPRM
jgi:hypothetical protein